VLLLLAADDSRDDLRAELTATLNEPPRELAPGLFQSNPAVDDEAQLPRLAFARQLLPAAKSVQAPSIKAWSTLVTEAVAGVLPDHQPWSLHVYPFVPIESSARMGARQWHSRGRERELQAPGASSKSVGVGQQRCDLVAAAVSELLAKRRRHLLRAMRPSPGAFGEFESLVQLMLTSPEQGYLSLAQAPLPFEQRHALSAFPAGRVVPEPDKLAPSRAYLKLLEAEARLGTRISARETCVDLGASPGGWTYVAARRGARVTAVDRAELRDDLMRLPNVRFQRGDAFGFEPTAPVDWLVCDVIAAAERSAELLLRWLERGWCRRFVVTIKLADGEAPRVLPRLRHELMRLAPNHFLLRLNHNKKEVCAFGSSAT
jgi:23S rRNA (cytidine2498-2'-O)-methyltransferase